ncbi:hypothetical protein EYF80_029332 [Liparis tanakae]|uniref:Uncharacterized protein n=1 Tax=Liparis tanakae TaxID=230148 RepID=A0A4Z2H4D3_9TELE|nr:hypothetical protein EYF80_029332 [Liparis tanakae]
MNINVFNTAERGIVVDVDVVQPAQVLEAGQLLVLRGRLGQQLPPLPLLHVPAEQEVSKVLRQEVTRGDLCSAYLVGELGHVVLQPALVVERGEQLGAPLAVLHLQAVVALLLGPRGPLLLQGGQLGHVAAQVDVQQRHQLLAEGAAQLRVGVRVNRAQDNLVLAGDDGADAGAARRWRREEPELHAEDTPPHLSEEDVGGREAGRDGGAAPLQRDADGPVHQLAALGVVVLQHHRRLKLLGVFAQQQARRHDGGAHRGVAEAVQQTHLTGEKIHSYPINHSHTDVPRQSVLETLL